MESSPVDPEAITLSPEAQQLYDAGVAYLDTAEAGYEPDEEIEDCDVREHSTPFGGDSSLHVRTYRNHPNRLFNMSGADSNGSWASVSIDTNGNMTQIEVELEDESVDPQQMLHELFDKAFKHEQIRAAEKAEARVAEAPLFGELTPLTIEESETILEQYINQENGNDILANILIDEDVLPVASQQLSETVRAHYSRVYRDNGRLATVAYIETAAGIVPQYYYLSSTQVAWRLLPGLEIAKVDGEERITKYDKADSEYALTLPAPMQKALASISKDWVFLDQETADDIKRAISTSSKTALAARYQDKLSLLQSPHLHRSLKFKNISPEKTVISEDHAALAPNYAETLDTWVQTRQDYDGNVAVEVVPSHDGTVHYMFMTDNAGRVWLGGADIVTAPVRPNGLRQGYIDLGNAAKPAMEKRDQAGDFGIEISAYGPVDIYQKFLSQVPLIKQYVDSRSPK